MTMYIKSINIIPICPMCRRNLMIRTGDDILSHVLLVNDKKYL